MKKTFIVTLAAAVLLLVSCADADSSSESSGFFENADEATIMDRAEKLSIIQNQINANAQAQLIYNALRYVCANMVVDGQEAKIPVGELSQTVVSKLEGDDLQAAVKDILYFNNIDDGMVSWVISEETHRPVSVSFEFRDESYTGTAPDPTPYPVPDSEIEALKEWITEPDYVSYADYLQGAEQSDIKRELTREEDLTMNNEEAKVLYEYLNSMIDGYVESGVIASLQEDNKISYSKNSNFTMGNVIYRKMAEKGMEDMTKFIDDLDPSGDRIYRPDSLVIFVKFDTQNKKLLFVQFSGYNGFLVGQYPDPIFDVDYPFIMGVKMDPALEYDPNTAVQKGIFDN